MIKLALSIALAAFLTACATTLEANAARAARFEQADAMADAALTRYCALHPLARAALRAQITAGVPVINCPGDLPGQAPAP